MAPARRALGTKMNGSSVNMMIMLTTVKTVMKAARQSRSQADVKAKPSALERLFVPTLRGAAYR